jgi:hypothetical protein
MGTSSIPPAAPGDCNATPRFQRPPRAAQSEASSTWPPLGAGAPAAHPRSPAGRCLPPWTRGEAERVGFEPTVPVIEYNSLAGSPIRPLSHLSDWSAAYPGEGGIRTPGALRLNGFQDRLLRPLGHLSTTRKTPATIGCDGPPDLRSMHPGALPSPEDSLQGKHLSGQ